MGLRFFRCLPFLAIDDNGMFGFFEVCLGVVLAVVAGFLVVDDIHSIPYLPSLSSAVDLYRHKRRFSVLLRHNFPKQTTTRIILVAHRASLSSMAVCRGALYRYQMPRQQGESGILFVQI